MGGPAARCARRSQESGDDRQLRRLHELGHRRIVLLVREERRKPYPATFEQAFLDGLKELGITTGPYNLPDWGMTSRASTAALIPCSCTRPRPP